MNNSLHRNIISANNISKIILFIMVIGLNFSCSSSKDKFINRSYHNTTTVFNVMYNGNNSLDKAEEIIVTNYTDDFREILPISPFETGMRAMKSNSHLKKASEKASKAIQKHSMNIGGNERNSHMDEAYLLLGKARFYQTKFIPALEAFNYIKINFRGGKAYYQALIWSARSQIELENYALAVSEIDDVLNNPNLEEKYRPQLYAYYSDALLQQKKYSLAVKMMKDAIRLEKDDRVKTRYTYILAQIYRLDEEFYQSTKTFDDVIGYGTPYKYVFHAKLDKAENFDPEQSELKVYIKALNEMLDEKRNANDLEKIHYQIGNVYYKDGYYDESEESLKKSIEVAKNKNFEKGLAYELLARVNFDQAEYKNAANYYDSTLTFMSKSYKNYKVVTRKRKQLDDVIKFIDISVENDSILKIVNMTEIEREIFFEDHIERLKAEEEKRKEEALLAAKLEAENQGSSTTLIVGKKGNFYFYNPVTLEHGKSEFVNKWGDRPLQDKWRIISKPINTIAAKLEEQEKNDSNNSGDKDDTTEQKTSINPLYTVEYYIKQIPTDNDTLSKLKSDRNFAYYALGLIYNEQFSKFELSGETLEQLLEYNPDENIKLPTYYYLYKDYKTLGYKVKKEKYKQIILNNYPDSRYAFMILNPEEVGKGDKKKIDILFESIITNLNNRKFRKVIALSDTLLSNYPSGDVIPKVELIKAMAIGKLGSSNEYKKALEYVMFNFPSEEASEQAKKLLEKLKKENSLKFDFNKVENYRIVVLTEKDTDFSDLKAKIKYPVWQKKLNISISEISYNNDAFVIYGFHNKEEANSFLREFIPKKVINSTIKGKKVDLFSISSYNFNILQRKKNLEFYLESYKK